MSLKNMFQSFVDAVKSAFSTKEQQSREDDDLTVVRASDAYAKPAPVAEPAPAKKPRKPRTPRTPTVK
jgi:hypothetical protein